MRPPGTGLRAVARPAVAITGALWVGVDLALGARGLDAVERCRTAADGAVLALWAAAFVAMALALVAVLARQWGRTGWLGPASVAVGAAGCLLAAALVPGAACVADWLDVPAHGATVLAAAGMAGLGVTAARTGVHPPWVALALCAGGILLLLGPERHGPLAVGVAWLVVAIGLRDRLGAHQRAGL